MDLPSIYHKYSPRLDFNDAADLTARGGLVLDWALTPCRDASVERMRARERVRVCVREREGERERGRVG